MNEMMTTPSHATHTDTDSDTAKSEKQQRNRHEKAHTGTMCTITIESGLCARKEEMDKQRQAEMCSKVTGDISTSQNQLNSNKKTALHKRDS